LVQKHITHNKLPTDAQSVVTPFTGQYWLDLEGETFCYTWRPNEKIYAWSRFTMPAKVQVFATSPMDDRVYARMGNGHEDSLFLYGGETNDKYYDFTDLNHMEVQTSLLDFGKPDHLKQVNGISVLAQGSYELTLIWRDAVEGGYGEQKLGRLHDSTMNSMRIPCSASGTHFGIRFESIDDKPLTIAGVAIHYTQEA